MSFIEELKRRNVVKVGVLYVVSGWLILQIADLLFDLMGLPTPWLRLVLALLILGFPLALIFSWVFEMTPDGLKREKDIDRSQSATAEAGHKINRVITVLLVVAIATVALDRLIPERPGAVETSGGSDVRSEEEASTKEADDSSAVAASRFAPAPEQSIAVLPFANMSGNVENEYFADGLSEEILNFLADVPDLRVTARTSSFQFKGRNVDIREVAGALNVAHVLEGSVRRSGERARITAQLIRAEDGYHLWSEAYDRTLEDTFQVQIEIAESVTRALGVVMDDRQRERMQDVGVRDVESFIHFQRGRKLFYESHSNNIDMAILAEAANEFTRAIELEPRFATAYHMRSDHAAHIMTMAGVADTERTAAAARQSDDLAQAIRYASNPYVKALVEVDRTLSSSDWRSARDRLEAALASPTCDEGTWIEVAPVFGYAEQTLARARRLIDCDPLNFYNYSLSATALLWSKQGQAANEIAARGLEVAPENPFLQSDSVDALVQLGRLDEALALARSSESAMHEARMARILAARSEADAAREWMAKVVAKAGPWLGPFVRLQLAAVVGDRDTANETAAWYDELPGGPLMLAGVVLECACGAPFDIEATPRFAERLAEAGVDWPPPTIIDFPLMREATGQH